MFREGKSAAYDVVLKRENIVVPSIELEWKEQNGKKVAWVKISTFTENLMTKERLLAIGDQYEADIAAARAADALYR